MSTTVHAEGAGSIAVGGDAINSIFVTGGVNQFFVGQYERLVDAYLSPRALYRELQLDRYTGRAWLLRQIDDFMAANDRGYVVIEAEAGMGKTAFLAWVARERRYVHHFVRLMPDANDIGVALRNLSAQLIRAWDLQSMAVGGVLPASAGRPDFFSDVLYEAADKRDATRPGERIVLAIDGLNETAVSSVQNPLALPAELPVGVYVVATQRTSYLPLTVLTPRRVLRIRPDSPDNRADIRAYLAVAVAAPDLAERVAGSGVSADELIRQLVDWCGGVWLVLRYVLAELRSGTRAPGDLSSLPVGLWQYYAQFWRGWQGAHETTWSTVDLPLLMALTAVEEPVTLDRLCAMSGCPDPDRAATLVGDPWRPFLQVEDGPQERYAAFHDSLGEFVAGRVDASALTSAERPFVESMAVAQRRAHQRIADRYLTAWGGLADGLPSLRGDAAMLDDGYGLRHLVHHLVRASADTVLHGLMELEWPGNTFVDPTDAAPVANAWYDVHRARRAFAGYALDVQRAWMRAEQDDSPAAARHITLELRYAVIAASVNSVAGNVPSELLLELIDEDLISPGQALELAREITDARTRAEALAALVSRLAGEPRSEALREALASVQLVPDGYWRAGELVRLAPIAGSGYLDDLLRIAQGLSRPYERDISLRYLAPDAQQVAVVQPDTFTFDPVDPNVFAAQYLQRTRRGVSTLLVGVGADLSGESNAEPHVRSTRFVGSPRWRAELLTASARSAPAGARREMLRAALNLSLIVGDREALDEAVTAIAVRMVQTGDAATALACLADVRDPEGRARALFTVAAHASPPHAADVAALAVEATATIADEAVRGDVLRRYGDQLGALFGQPELAGVLASLGEAWRPAVLGACAGTVDGRREALLAEALSTVVSGRQPGRWEALAELIPRLPAELIAPARDAVDLIDNPEQRDRAAAALAERLCRLGQAAAAEEVVATVNDPWWAAEARFAVACVLADRGQHDLAAGVAEGLESAPRRAEAFARAGRLEPAYELADRATDPATRVAILLRIGSVAAEAGRDGIEQARAGLADVSDPVVLPPLVNAVSLALATGGRPDAAVDLLKALTDTQRGAALIALAPDVAGAVAEAAALARALRDPVDRGRALASLTPALMAAGQADLRGHVRQVLRLLASGTRAQLLSATSDLVPAIVALAGPQGLVDLSTAIAAARRWWP